MPAGAARFAGAWAAGAWDGVLPHVLVVEAVDAAGRAQVVYALGDAPEGEVRRGSRRVTGRIDGDTLRLELGGGARAVYRIAGEALRGTYTSDRRLSTVTLLRASLQDAARVPARAAGVVPGTAIRIPMTEAGPGGRAITLEATLYRPAGDGPHPVVLFNHGSTGGGAVAATATLRPTRQAPFFVARGFAVLAPMRRGRGASEGAHAEQEGSCDPALLGPGLARAIEDVDAAMAFLRAQPWADPDRVLIAGQSRGGILSVAYAAERPGTDRGVINFAGGWTTEKCDRSTDGFNTLTFAAAGAQVCALASEVVRYGRPDPDGNALEASPRAAVPHRVFALDVLACPPPWRPAARYRHRPGPPSRSRPSSPTFAALGPRAARPCPTRLGRNRVDSSLDQALEASLSPPRHPRLDREPAAAQDHWGPAVALDAAPSTAPFRAHRRGSRGRQDWLDTGRPRGGGVNRSYAPRN